LAIAALDPATHANAQTPQALAEARRLFTEALADEQAHRFDVALEKFRRVQHVRDTMSVRYRVGACLEGLGRLREARATFVALIDDAGKPTGDDVETVRSAAARIDDLNARIPKLTLKLSPHASASAEIRVDKALIPTSTLVDPLLLDPGDHVIEATSADAPPFRTRFALDERAHVELTIPLDPATATPPVPSTSATTTAPRPSVEPPSPPPRTLPVLAIAGGGALIVASGVTLLVRHGDIAEINRLCHNGVCPASQQAEITSTRNRALFEGPLGVAFGVAGVALAGVGIYFMLGPRDPASPSIALGADGIRLRGSF
jgi:hypothetical protein